MDGDTHNVLLTTARATPVTLCSPTQPPTLHSHPYAHFYTLMRPSLQLIACSRSLLVALYGPCCQAERIHVACFLLLPRDCLPCLRLDTKLYLSTHPAGISCCCSATVHKPYLTQTNIPCLQIRPTGYEHRCKCEAHFAYT